MEAATKVESFRKAGNGIRTFVNKILPATNGETAMLREISQNGLTCSQHPLLIELVSEFLLQHCKPSRYSIPELI